MSPSNLAIMYIATHAEINDYTLPSGSYNYALLYIICMKLQ